MKRRDLMKTLGQIAKAAGEDLVTREGGSHTIVTIGDRKTPVPRHNEINEYTAKGIINYMRGE
ncbi:HicA-like toxin [Gordonia phage Reyja]|uniref:HicA-like toxin n=1 Tax=Gordonia phage Reyja TaxID=2571250 RepID=A0A4D6T6W3_9CAUD|nr:HicA-like toxin [Gordonia phage Reyja]QCG77808.1 HicA-like toxin [Gordonia phage Reyja]